MDSICRFQPPCWTQPHLLSLGSATFRGWKNMGHSHPLNCSDRWICFFKVGSWKVLFLEVRDKTDSEATCFGTLTRHVLFKHRCVRLDSTRHRKCHQLCLEDWECYFISSWIPVAFFVGRPFSFLDLDKNAEKIKNMIYIHIGACLNPVTVGRQSMHLCEGNLINLHYPLLKCLGKTQW